MVASLQAVPAGTCSALALHLGTIVEVFNDAVTPLSAQRLPWQLTRPLQASFSGRGAPVWS